MRKPLSSAGTPLTETLSPSIPLDQIGQTLASIYDDLVSEGVPEHLAALRRRHAVTPERAGRQFAAPRATPRDLPTFVHKRRVRVA